MTMYLIIGEWIIGRTPVKQSFGAYFDEIKANTRLRKLAESNPGIDFSIEEIEAED